MILLIFLTAIGHNANCEIDVYKSVPNRQFVTPQKMPTIYRNLLFLKENCGEVCDTSDNFVKKPGKYFDVIKKAFECDFLLESSSMYQKLIFNEQMIKEVYLHHPGIVFQTFATIVFVNDATSKQV